MLNAIVIAGPTACGKSEAALAVAKTIGGEIVSVDAGAVYREMDIGTAKPPAQWRREVRHHLLDVRNPDERFDAGAFCALARAAAEDIAAREKTPVFAGGTMMYFRALRERLHELPAVPQSAREEIARQMRELGAAKMHEELKKADPQSAEKIETKDRQRISRALEVFRATGKPLSEWTDGARPPPFLRLRAALFLPADRALLRQRIGERLQKMFAEGLAEETRAVVRKWKLPPSAQSLRLAGYRQASAFLRGELSEKEMRERAFFATCQLAKRQFSWLRAWDGAELILDPFADNSRARLLDFAKKAGDK